jgi:glycine hydroxymethyltransferase
MDKIQSLIKAEQKRQKETLTLIPSENHTPKIMEKLEGSLLTNKYAEGYPGKRYYQGNNIADEVETLAINRAKELFGVPHANVQPYSGSPANTAVLFALLDKGDKVCGLKLSSGGHLTHGHPEITFSGKYFKSVQYSVDEKGKLDYEKIAKLVKKEKPKVIFAGTTAYPFLIDFKKFGQIADSVSAYLVADISHIAGLVVAGVHQSPVPYAHLVTTTTHKTLRGPRGAMILVTTKGIKKDKDLASKIDKAVFPGLQGGPHLNAIASIAYTLKEAKKEKFSTYAKNIILNAKALEKALRKKGIKVFGTQNHLMLLDFSDFGGGSQMALALERVGIIVNKNLIPNDKLSPFNPSGIRIGTPAITTRGAKANDMEKIADWIHQVYDEVKDYSLPSKKEDRKKFFDDFKLFIKKNSELERIGKEVSAFAKSLPLFQK